MTYKALAIGKTTNDLVFVNRDLQLVEDAEAVSQRVKQHLRFYLREWFLDTTIGVPWIDYIFVRPFDQATAEAIVKDAVLSVPGVKEITSFGVSFYPEKRRFDIFEMQIRTEFDEVVSVNG